MKVTVIEPFDPKAVKVLGLMKDENDADNPLVQVKDGRTIPLCDVRLTRLFSDIWLRRDEVRLAITRLILFVESGCADDELRQGLRAQMDELLAPKAVVRSAGYDADEEDLWF
jgi:hypothetical protein